MSGPPQGTIRPTRISTLVAVFVIGGMLGYLVVPFAEWINGTAPTVEWTSVWGLAFAATLVLALAVSTHRQVQREQRRIPPQRALNFVVFAKACAGAGSLLAGGYLGFAVHFVGQMDAPLPRERVIRSIVAAVAAAIVTAGGLLLERACRVPRDDDDE